LAVQEHNKLQITFHNASVINIITITIIIIIIIIIIITGLKLGGRTVAHGD